MVWVVWRIFTEKENSFMERAFGLGCRNPLLSMTRQ
jgi:hypothetical protein